MFSHKIHPDLVLAQNLPYKKAGFIFEKLKIEDESSDYGAADFSINNRSIKFRVGKITPTKVGQFVTFWKRIDKGPIIPYDVSDSFDFLIVSTRFQNHLGQFVFPKALLCQKGIISLSQNKGKRAMRIYPPWSKADNSQAKKTQTWQLNYFVKISNEESDFDLIRFLFNIS